MKPTIRAKIGTHSATILVLWKDYKQGDTTVLAMELDQWGNAHWSYRRLKSCGFWKTLSMGRKGLGIELKESYFKQGIENMKFAKDRFKKLRPELF